MNNTETAILILTLALSVAATRFLPFILFRKTDSLPKTIVYLGKVLPAAMMGLLAVYCFRDYPSFKSMAEMLPGMLAAGTVVVLHTAKRNTILSISAGTAVYMLLLRIM